MRRWSMAESWQANFANIAVNCVMVLRWWRACVFRLLYYRTADIKQAVMERNAVRVKAVRWYWWAIWGSTVLCRWYGSVAVSCQRRSFKYQSCKSNAAKYIIGGGLPLLNWSFLFRRMQLHVQRRRMIIMTNTTHDDYLNARGYSRRKNDINEYEDENTWSN